MDHSSFTVTTGKAATAIPPPSATAAPPPQLPLAMREQSPDAANGLPVEAVASPELAAAPTAEQTTAAVVEAAAAPAESSPPAEEPAPVVEPERPAKVDPRFSQLARKEAELHRAREAVKAEKAALEQAHRQVVAFEEARNAAKRDPLAALEALGLSYDDLTEQMLNGKKPTPSGEVAALRQELEQLRVEQEQARARAEQAAASRLEAERAAIIDEARQAAVAHVEANADRYTLTSINGGASLVPQVREQHFARTGQLLTIEQAANLVEKHFEGIADRVVKARQGIPAKAAASTAAPAANPPAAPRTLSNALTASPSVAAPKARTEADRIKAALARLEGK